jgi:hypothetical protein
MSQYKIYSTKENDDMKSAGGNGTKMRNSPDIHFMGLAIFSSIFLFCIAC